MKKHTLVVLAAGMGSRYGGLKQLDLMSEEGDTLIDFSLYDAIQAGFSKVVFIIREDFKDRFVEIYDQKLKGKIEVAYVFQELHKIPSGYQTDPNRTKPWGTGHATLMIQDEIQGNFCVINGDDFYGRGAFQTMIKELDRLAPDSHDMCMVGYQLKNTLSANGTVSRGECFLNASDELIQIVERHQIERTKHHIQRKDEEEQVVEMSEETLVSMNFWGFTPRYVEVATAAFHDFLAERSHELKSEFYIPTVVNKVIEEEMGVVKVLTTDAQWMGVTYSEDRISVVKEVSQMKSEAVYPKNLWD